MGYIGPESSDTNPTQLSREAADVKRRNAETEGLPPQVTQGTQHLRAEAALDEFEREIDAEALAVASDAHPRRVAQRWSILRRGLAAADLVAGLLAGLVAALLAGFPPEGAAAFVGVVAVGWILSAFVCGLYAGEDLRSWASGIAETPRLVIGALLLSWPLFAAGKILGLPGPATAALIACLVAPLAAGMSRAGARALVHRMHPLRQRTVIIGSGQVAGTLATRLRSHAEFGLIPIGIVDDEVHRIEGPQLPVLGRLDELPAIMSKDEVDRVIIAFSRASHEQLLHCIRTCRDRGVAVDVVPRLFELLDGARALDQVGGLPLLSLGVHRLSHSSRLAKRGLDIAISGLALTLLSPLLLVIAAAIRLESRGHALFRQPRAGREGQVFQLLKFRSMHADAEEHKEALGELNDLDDGVMFKIRRDPRITRVGGFLRRFSLDELPQLVNVLTGQMSLVGPRPLILPESDALSEGWHGRRLDLRPGMTGPWQIAGRSEIPFHEMVRFDYQYVAGWSLGRDLEILLATVPAVLSGRGAY